MPHVQRIRLSITSLPNLRVKLRRRLSVITAGCLHVWNLRCFTRHVRDVSLHSGSVLGLVVYGLHSILPVPTDDAHPLQQWRLCGYNRELHSHLSYGQSAVLGLVLRFVTWRLPVPRRIANSVQRNVCVRPEHLHVDLPISNANEVLERSVCRQSHWVPLQHDGSSSLPDQRNVLRKPLTVPLRI
jgi:hypothetical protein